MTTYTTTVDPNGGADYISLSAWVAGEQSLYTGSDIAKAECFRTGALKDTGQVNCLAFISTPQITVNENYRHEGKFSDTRESNGNYIYILEVTDLRAIYNLNKSNAAVNWITIQILGTANNLEAIRSDGSLSGLTINNNIIKLGLHTGTDSGILIFNNGGNANIYNNIVIGATTNGIAVSGAVGLVNVSNNITYGTTAGQGIWTNNTNVVARNNISMNNSVGDFVGTYNANSDFNISSDSSAPGANKAILKTNYSAYFVDAANDDFHLLDTSYALFGLIGEDLSATFIIDIDGEIRDQLMFGVGADFITQFVALVEDSHVKALADYLPNGRTFEAKNIKGSNFNQLLRGIAHEFKRSQDLIALFEGEFIPDNTTLYLDEWERAVGIPDNCFLGTGTDFQRRSHILMKLASLGVQSVEDFVGLAAILGLTATIEPKIDTKTSFPLSFPITYISTLDLPADRFTIVITLTDPTAPTFPLPFPMPMGTSASGVLYCLYNKLKPANCRIEFNLTA